MKFRVPSAAPGSGSPGAGGGLASRGRPDWLKRWLEDQGKWFLLSCGCRDAWDEKSLTVLHLFGPKETQIFCEQHERFVLWEKWIPFNEYMQLAPAVTPDEPLF